MALVGWNKGNFLDSLTVEPEVMREKAFIVKEKIRLMQNAFEEAERTVNKTGSYWIGEAADAHREYYSEKKEDIRQIFSRLTEDVSDLYEMADVYSKTERELTELASDLPSDVII